MLKISIMFSAVFACTGLTAQSLSPSVVASGGGFKTTSAGSLSFTIGETSISTLKTTNSILTQGFQQGNLNKTGVVQLDAGAVNIQLFPSPASTYLEFNISTPEYQVVEIAIYDILGHKICDVQDIHSSGSAHHAVLGTADLPDAVYFAIISITGASGSTQYFSKRFIINN